ncbi:uncharacterized protein BO66DRAFT_411095 [Aspergillus aculeatinus CBS 121060]|uniref:Uncharacterized protein n=1 Tax=Aspergillus aculeatinus CBS 121060 TaxID=1448322 RepID=A0ACD1HB38_9EURO|nr:hypothetical protein BO66DRAFT_411095 [Aspergillus aculeatinus CBS 121060]RAH70767.1 hypothetical protein BO66DRAFT_411095 [Aspergillus aculeatinus CBS 121060]
MVSTARLSAAWSFTADATSLNSSMEFCYHPDDEDSAIPQQDKSHLSTRASSDSDSFPTAFDTSLSNNFTTTTCPNFFKSFLSNSTIASCHAVSMLLRDSSSFFHVLTSATLTSELLDTACASNVTDCASIFSALAVELLKEDVCGKDYSAGNPLVTNAYTDMITYEPLYRATCLQSPSTKNYCFVDAISNTTNSADYDVYFLPYGSTISASPSPTCNKCLQATLALFATWAEVDGQPLVNSYIPSAEAINTDCGENFANVNITVGSEKVSSGSGLVVPLPQWSSRSKLSDLTSRLSLLLL